ncbi:MAG: hypothetical protein AAFN92_18970, partial [Bacteroidota bacterium]
YQILGGLRAGMGYTGCKTIEELKRDQKDKILDRKSMDQVTGGKRRGSWLRRVCGGIIPQ